MNIWLKDEHGKPSASLTFLTMFCTTALVMWVLAKVGAIARDVTAEDVSFVAGTGIALYGFRKGQKEGWGLGSKAKPAAGFEVGSTGNIPADQPGA